MRWIALIAIGIIALHGTTLAANFTLRATWTANTDSDMKEYRLYRTDGSRTLTGIISHPSTSYTFSLSIPGQSPSSLTFALTAVDVNNNESPDSNIAPVDITAPSPPRNLKKIK